MSVEPSGSYFRKTNIYINLSLAVLARYTKLLPYIEVHVIKLAYSFLHANKAFNYQVEFDSPKLW